MVFPDERAVRAGGPFFAAPLHAGNGTLARAAAGKAVDGRDVWGTGHIKVFKALTVNGAEDSRQATPVRGPFGMAGGAGAREVIHE